MATVYSTQRTNSRATPAVMNKANEMSGRIRVAHGTYEASSLASGTLSKCLSCLMALDC